MPTETCEHADGVAVDEDSLAPSKRTSDSMFFFCGDCGTFFDESGETVTDPTIDEVPDTQKKPTGRPKTQVSAQQENDGTSPVQLDSAAELSQPHGTNGAVSEHVPALPAEHQGGESLPTDTPATATSTTKPRTSASVSDAAQAALTVNQILPGPWEGAPCPNLKKHGCKGKMQAFHTLASPAYGNTYFYRCDEDQVQVAIDFKKSPDDRKQ